MIFGTTKSYILYDSVTTTLPKSTTDFDLLQNQDIRHKSILTGKRTTSRTGDYASFTVTDWLFTEQDPTAKFLSLRDLIDKQVYFYFQGSSLIINCYVYEVKPFYIKNAIRYDAVRITLFPLNYFAISSVLQTEDGIDILTEDGQKIRTEGLVL